MIDCDVKELAQFKAFPLFVLGSQSVSLRFNILP